MRMAERVGGPLREVYTRYLERLGLLVDGDVVLIGNATDPDRPDDETRTGQLIAAWAAIGFVFTEFPLFGVQRHIYSPRFSYTPTAEIIAEFLEAEEEVGFIESLQNKPGLVVVVMGQYPCRMLAELLPNALFVPHMTVWFWQRFRRPIYDALKVRAPSIPEWETYTGIITKTVATPATMRLWRGAKYADWRRRKALQSASVGSATFKRKWREDPSFREMHTRMNKAKMRKLWSSQAFRESKRRWYDAPETRAMMSRNGREQLRKLRADPVFMEKFLAFLSRRQKALWADPVWREKTEDAIKKSWEKRRYDDVAYANTKSKCATASQSARSDAVQNYSQTRGDCAGKDDIIDIVATIRAAYGANPNVAMVEVAWKLCIKPDFLHQKLRGVRHDQREDVELLAMLDAIEGNSGAGPRVWRAAVDVKMARYLWDNGLSAERIALLMLSPARSTDVMHALGFSSVEEMRRSRRSNDSSNKETVNKVMDEQICVLAATYTGVPADRLVRVCSQQAFSPATAKLLLAKIADARGEAPSAASSEGGAESSILENCSHKSSLSALASAINIGYAANPNVGKLDIRWGLGYREARFVKDCKSLVDYYSEDVDLMRKLETIKTQPQKSCKKWQDAVDLELARYMWEKGFTLEAASLLCPRPTRQEEVALALGYANLKAAQKDKKTSPVTVAMISELAKSFPALTKERILKVCCEKLKDGAYEAMSAAICTARNVSASSSGSHE